MKSLNENQANAKIFEICERHGLSNDQIQRDRFGLIWDALKIIHGKDIVSEDLWNDLQKTFSRSEYPRLSF
jgi:hypothetical protein